MGCQGQGGEQSEGRVQGWMKVKDDSGDENSEEVEDQEDVEEDGVGTRRR